MSNNLGVEIMTIMTRFSAQLDVLFDVINDMTASVLFENLEAVGMVLFQVVHHTRAETTLITNNVLGDFI